MYGLPGRLERRLAAGLGHGPTFRWSPRNSGGRVESFISGSQAEVAVDALHEPEQPLDLLGNLRLRHEAVRVVLAELPHAREPRQDA